ncbi:hypothetical protein B0H17DRAFT_1146374 [Mycena rosella]|uniref:Uncharacterized protein n=1 Tax=Mycena rosella TaxID=1033263 RepID=A0AAD7CP68_MYCRO|nr:hypothetical protein B0H17DRAFT_1146374 [Mycena rosella]
MLPFPRLSRAIVSYRLGYSLQRPYPGRWTTPVVLGVFILLAAALAAINVPLSAYDMDQESTFRPNDTLPPRPFSSLIPEILQHPTGGFSPQMLTVGNTIQFNNSVFKFNITAAFNELDNTQPVSSFSYYNNPFSGGCDVMAVTVTCRIPTLFTLEWNPSSAWLGLLNPAQENLVLFAEDLDLGFQIWTPGYNRTSITDFAVTVEPCCNCAAEPSQAAEASMDQDGASLLPNHPPCSSLPARFVVTEGDLFLQTSSEAGDFNLPGVNNTNIFEDPSLRDEAPDALWSELNTLLKNTFQSLYHLVRMELGVILENQIYASPEMYNNSISDVSVDSALEHYPPTSANTSRLATTNATPYLTSLREPSPRRIPADKVVCEDDEATIHPGPYVRKDLEGQQRSMQEWDTGEASLFVSEDKRITLIETLLQRLGTVEKSSAAMAEMQARMRLSLRARGILEEVDEDHWNINEVERERRDRYPSTGGTSPSRAPSQQEFNSGFGGLISGSMPQMRLTRGEERYNIRLDTRTNQHSTCKIIAPLSTNTTRYLENPRSVHCTGLDSEVAVTYVEGAYSCASGPLSCRGAVPARKKKTKNKPTLNESRDADLSTELRARPTRGGSLFVFISAVRAVQTPKCRRKTVDSRMHLRRGRRAAKSAPWVRLLARGI